MNYAAIFPVGADTTVITGITDAISGDVGIVLAVLAFMLGLRWVLRLFNRATRGKV